MKTIFDRKTTNNLNILLKAVSEKEVNGKVNAKCPKRNSIIVSNGTSTKTSCNCGLMSEIMRVV